MCFLLTVLLALVDCGWGFSEVNNSAIVFACFGGGYFSPEGIVYNANNAPPQRHARSPPGYSFFRCASAKAAPKVVPGANLSLEMAATNMEGNTSAARPVANAAFKQQYLGSKGVQHSIKEYQQQ